MGLAGKSIDNMIENVQCLDPEKMKWIRVVSDKLLLMKKYHCSKGGTNGNRNYPNQSYYGSTNHIYGTRIEQHELALRVHHRSGTTTKITQATSS
jgi:hypothetical protein